MTDQELDRWRKAAFRYGRKLGLGIEDSEDFAQDFLIELIGMPQKPDAYYQASLKNAGLNWKRHHGRNAGRDWTNQEVPEQLADPLGYPMKRQK